MKHLLDYKSEDFYQNSALMMSYYISTLSERKIDFYDFSWKNEVFYIQEFNGSVDAAFLFGQDHVRFVGVFRDNDLCMGQLEVYQDKASSVFYDIDTGDAAMHMYEDALRYMKIIYDSTDNPAPAITTACWSESSEVYACEETEEFCLNGGELAAFLGSSSADDIENYFLEEYEIEDIQIEFAMLLFDAKMRKTPLSRNVVSLFLSQCVNQQVVLNAINNFGIHVTN